MRKICALCLIVSMIFSVTSCKKGEKKESVEVTKLSAEALYNRAKKYLDIGLWSNAIAGYTGLRNQYPFGRYAEQGSLELAYAYYKNHNAELAISTLDLSLIHI